MIYFITIYISSVGGQPQSTNMVLTAFMLISFLLACHGYVRWGKNERTLVLTLSPELYKRCNTVFHTKSRLLLILKNLGFGHKTDGGNMLTIFRKDGSLRKDNLYLLLATQVKSTPPPSGPRSAPRKNTLLAKILRESFNKKLKITRLELLLADRIRDMMKYATSDPSRRENCWQQVVHIARELYALGVRGSEAPQKQSFEAFLFHISSDVSGEYDRLFPK